MVSRDQIRFRIIYKMDSKFWTQAAHDMTEEKKCMENGGLFNTFIYKYGKIPIWRHSETGDVLCGGHW